MTCHIGEGAVFCTPGPWRSAGVIECPWCKEQRRCIEALVFGGWCGSDYICGTCGSLWNSDDGRFQKLTEDKRDENIATAAAVKDPSCWKCFDSGIIENPIALAACDCPSVTPEVRAYVAEQAEPPTDEPAP